MAYMYGGAILQIDLSEGKISKEPTASYSSAFLGGRGVNIRLLYDGVPPEIDPFDPANLLIFGVGPLCGTPVPASRTEVTTKSPETGFLGSSSFGGYFGPELKYAGYDHIVLTGRADKPVYLWIDNERVEIRDASNIWGKDTYETQAIIRSEVDPEAKVLCIGPAGENLVRFATVQHELGHGGGRTGTGAVMGSKNLKAIVVRGTKEVTLADPEKYLTIAGELEQELRNHPVIQEWQKHGLTLYEDKMGELSRESGIERPRPGRSGASPPVKLYDIFMKYKPQKAGCLGCPAQCMELYPMEVRGGGVVSCAIYPFSLYTVGNSDMDLGLECGFLAQRYGIDILSSTIIISWLMRLYERGLITAKDTDGIPMEWGSREAIVGMLKKIAHREGFGDVLADSILPAAEKIGRGARDYAYHMKGLPMYYEGQDPDGLIPRKGTALAMVMSSRGDIMRGRPATLVEELDLMRLLTDEKRADQYKAARLQKVRELTGTEEAAVPDSYVGKPELVVYAENVIIACDCLSACKFTGSFLSLPFDETHQAALLSAGTGVDASVDTLFEFAGRVKNLERAYCAREGMTRETDSLPKMYMDRPVEKGESKGSILKSSEFEEAKSKYYALRGWDIGTGVPTRETLEQTGLGDIAQDLERRGKLPKKSAEGQNNSPGAVGAKKG